MMIMVTEPEKEWTLKKMSENELEKEMFVIDDDFKAEWALKKIAENNEEYNRKENTCKEFIEYYAQIAADEKKKCDNNNAYFVSALEYYFRSIKPKETKTQATYSLPSGKLVMKLEKEEIKHDADKLVELLKDTEYVELAYKLKWGEYKKTLKIIDEKVIDASGEIIEGAKVEVSPAKFGVEVLACQK